MEADLAEYIQVGLGPAGYMVVLAGRSLVEGILAVAAQIRVEVRIACFC